MAGGPRSERNFRGSETKSRRPPTAVRLRRQPFCCRNNCRCRGNPWCIARHSRRAATQRADKSAARERYSRSIELAAGRHRSAGLRVNEYFRCVGRTLLVIFLTAGALICLVVMLALVFPDRSLESIWRLKPEARTQFHAI